MGEVTTPLLIQLDGAERDALRKFMASRTDRLSEAQAARLLIRDALIGMGDLAPHGGKLPRRRV